jgi:hypothetical protein
MPREGCLFRWVDNTSHPEAEGEARNDNIYCEQNSCHLIGHKNAPFDHTYGASIRASSIHASKPREVSSGEITTLPFNRKKSTIEALQAYSMPERVSPKV